MAQIQNTNAFDSQSNVNLNTHRASGMPDILEKGGNLAVTTTNIEVYANDMKVGFVQTFNPSETRTIVKVRELGTEGVIQSVPSNTNGGQISISRFAIYNSNLFAALGLTPTGKFTLPGTQLNGDTSKKDPAYGTYGNPFKTLKDQRVPLEFKVKTRMPDNKQYIETYIDCWLSTYSKTIASNTITITESATVQYSDVTIAYV